jgi:hypothetical protein
LTRNVPFSRRLLLAVDAQGYGSGDDRQQSEVQAGLLAVLDQAAEETGVDRSAWAKQHAGDSEFAVLPPEQAGLEPRLVRDFPAALRAALADHNAALRDEYRLRLRLAIHHGIANTDVAGFSGRGAVHVARLVDCPQAKSALVRVPGAELVLVLSEQVFDDTVAQRRTLPLAAADFCRVEVRNKEFREPAYLHVPGVDPGLLDLSAQPDAAPDAAPQAAAEPPAPAASVQSVFTGPVDVRHGTIGISNQWPS